MHGWLTYHLHLILCIQECRRQCAIASKKSTLHKHSLLLLTAISLVKFVSQPDRVVDCILYMG